MVSRRSYRVVSCIPFLPSVMTSRNSRCLLDANPFPDTIRTGYVGNVGVSLGVNDIFRCVFTKFVTLVVWNSNWLEPHFITRKSGINAATKKGYL
mmetsp:Transcript_62134/g.92117  ORF Transcript_62134/g.92117 Transcript_62134/m.92117 type:complete len:95 (+) Transcript_62134:283-567(+)